MLVGMTWTHLGNDDGKWRKKFILRILGTCARLRVGNNRNCEFSFPVLFVSHQITQNYIQYHITFCVAIIISSQNRHNTQWVVCTNGVPTHFNSLHSLSPNCCVDNGAFFGTIMAQEWHNIHTLSHLPSHRHVAIFRHRHFLRGDIILWMMLWMWALGHRHDGRWYQSYRCCHNMSSRLHLCHRHPLTAAILQPFLNYFKLSGCLLHPWFIVDAHKATRCYKMLQNATWCYTVLFFYMLNSNMP